MANAEMLKAWSPYAMAGASLLGTGVNALMMIGGARKAEKAQKKAIKQQERIFERQFAQEKKVARQTYRLSRQQLQESKKVNAFNRQQTFVNNFLSTLNANPQIKMQFIAANRGRA